jgi:DNA-binding CsgD family transcriptional regulator
MANPKGNPQNLQLGKNKGDRILTFQNRRVLTELKKGNSMPEAMRKAGYSDSSVKSYGNQLLKKFKMMKVLDKAGLDENTISDSLRVAMTSGLGVKATNSDSIKALQLIYQLRGDLDKEKEDTGNTTNIYIKELKTMSDEQLLEKLHALEAEVVDER